MIRLKKKVKDRLLKADKRGFSNTLLGGVIGLLVSVIMVFDVAIPVVKNAIVTANLTGTSLTIANLIPMFMVLGVFVMVAALMVIRFL